MHRAGCERCQVTLYIAYLTTAAVLAMEHQSAVLGVPGSGGAKNGRYLRFPLRIILRLSLRERMRWCLPFTLSNRRKKETGTD